MATRTKSIAQELNRFFGRVPGEPNTKNFQFNPKMQECTSCWRIDDAIRENKKPGITGIFKFGRPVISIDEVSEKYAEILIHKEKEEFCFNPAFDREASKAFFEKMLGKELIGGIKPLKSEKYAISWEYDPAFRVKKRLLR